MIYFSCYSEPVVELSFCFYGPQMTERQCPQLTKLSQVADNEEILKQLKEEMRKLAAARKEQV